MAGVIGEIISGAVSGLTDIGKTIYDIFTNERDFDYQKSLQRDVFAREDNAVQRRMEDLKEAGLNPNLAAGSAAGVGAVVGRSNTPSLSGNPVGSALDAAQHVQQLRAQSMQNKILKNEELKSAADAAAARSNAKYQDLQNTYDELALLYQLGLTSDTSLRVRPDGTFTILHGNEKPGDYSITNTPLQNQLEWQWRNNKNAADMLQKDNEFYVGDKIAQYIGQGVQAFSGAGSGYFNFNRRR